MSAREERKRRAREEREAATLRRVRRDAHRRRVGLASGLAVMLCLVAVVVVVMRAGERRSGEPAVTAVPIPAQRTADLDTAVRLAGARRVSYSYDYGIGEHTDDRVAYPTNPPTNGPHAFSWAADGSYAGLPAPVIGQVVHAQEHGRVVIQYRPGLAQRTLRQLQALYEESSAHILLIENATGMSCDVAATAWGQSVLCPEINAGTFDALRAFRDTYRDRGPEFVA